MLFRERSSQRILRFEARALNSATLSASEDVPIDRCRFRRVNRLQLWISRRNEESGSIELMLFNKERCLKGREASEQAVVVEVAPSGVVQ